MVVSEQCDFEMEKRHGLLPSNILFKKIAAVTSPRLGKQPSLKMFKLS